MSEPTRIGPRWRSLLLSIGIFIILAAIGSAWPEWEPAMVRARWYLMGVFLGYRLWKIGPEEVQDVTVSPGNGRAGNETR
jgi:hypothetical protein